MSASALLPESGGWSLWLWWIAAHTAAFTAIKWLGDSAPVMALSPRPRTMVKGALVGGCLALAQYLVMLRLVPWAVAWAAASLIAWAFGFCVGESFVEKRPRGQFLFGAIVGAAQAAMLATQGSGRPLLWFAACCLSLGGSDTAMKIAIRRHGFPVRLSVVVLGLVIGGVTGALLVADLG